MDGLLDSIATIIENNPWLAFPASFGGGLVSSASPCVLAIFPLMIGFVGGYAEGSQRKAIYYSLALAIGLTITFTIMGVAVGALGSFFGNLGDVGKYVLPPVLVLLGVNLLGIIKLNPGISPRYLPKQKALLGAFLIGLVFGVLATPCATPVLAVILTLSATQDNLAHSGALLFFYALGHWALILVAGFSVGFAQQLVKSRGLSRMSDYTKKAAGVLLVGTGIYLFAGLF